MNFYKHHLGDYAAHTSHLSWDEDAAYRRLLDQYYKREAALPADPKEACRLVRASSPAQRKAVDAVLREFFTLQADGWHQKRCDEEIKQASAQAETNRRIAEEREARRRARVVHESLAHVGERIVHEASAAKEHESCTPTMVEREPSQTPDSTSQTPDSKTPDSKKKRKARVPALTVPELMADGLSESMASEWLSHRERKGSPLTPLAWRGIKDEAIKADWTYEQAVQKAMARGWTGFEAEWVRGERMNGHNNGHAHDRAERRLQTAGLMTGQIDRRKQQEVIDVAPIAITP